MKKIIIIIFFFSFLCTTYAMQIYGMHKKVPNFCYYGTMISIEEEMNICSKLPILSVNKNNYYIHLQNYAQAGPQKPVIATYGLSSYEPNEQACSINHILFFVFNNPGVYACIQFVVKTKQEYKSSVGELLGALNRADMHIQSIY